MPGMPKAAKNARSARDPVVVYSRLDPDDHDELKRREERTGAPIAAQIRILVHNALRSKGVIK